MRPRQTSHWKTELRLFKRRTRNTREKFPMTAPICAFVAGNNFAFTIAINAFRIQNVFKLLELNRYYSLFPSILFRVYTLYHLAPVSTRNPGSGLDWRTR